MKRYITKFLETSYENGIVTTKKEYKFADFEEGFFNILDSNIGVCGNDDYESAYFNGIHYDWDEFGSIDVDNAIKAVSEKLESLKKDDEEETLNFEDLKNAYDELIKYKGFIIHYHYIPKELNDKITND